MKQRYVGTKGLDSKVLLNSEKSRWIADWNRQKW